MSLRNRRSLPVEAISRHDGGLLRWEMSALPTATADFVIALPRMLQSQFEALEEPQGAVVVDVEPELQVIVQDILTKLELHTE